MFVITAWKPCATRYPWFFRKMYCSLEPFMKTSAGVMKHASDEEVQRVCKLAQADGFIQEFPNGYNTKNRSGR